MTQQNRTHRNLNVSMSTVVYPSVLSLTSSLHQHVLFSYRSIRLLVNFLSCWRKTVCARCHPSVVNSSALDKERPSKPASSEAFMKRSWYTIQGSRFREVGTNSSRGRREWIGKAYLRACGIWTPFLKEFHTVITLKFECLSLTAPNRLTMRAF